MTGKRVGKVLLVWLCIITLIMPFASNVLAVAKLTNDDNVSRLATIPLREGGEESTGINSSLYGHEYDKTQYDYSVEGVNVLKIVQENDGDYQDTFYCLNAEKSFSVQNSGYDYVKVADDLADLTDEDVENWATSIGISENNLKSLIYLLNNLYAKKLDSTYKDTYIAEAFKEEIADEETTPPTTVELKKTI